MSIHVGMLLGPSVEGSIANPAAFGDYEIYDSFSTDIAAGSVIGANADPGPGKIAGTDSGSKASVSSGALIVADSVASNDPNIMYGPIGRAAGKVLLAQFSSISTENHVRIGFGADPNVSFKNGLRFVLSAAIALNLQNGNPSIGSYIYPGSYEIAVLLSEAGALYFVKGEAYAKWTLLYIDTTNTDSTLYCGYQMIGAGRGYSSTYIKLPLARWFPSALASDGFGTAGNTTDGLGHHTGIIDRIFSGDGVTWVGTAWSNSSGKTSGNPTIGSELLTDGALENWNSTTDLTSWTETIGGTTTITRDSSNQHGGTYSVSFTVDGSNSVAKINQSITNSNGDWILVTFWAKCATASKSVAIDENFGTNQGPALTLTSSYQQFVTLIRATKANTDLGLKRVALGGATAYIDDISAKVLTIAEAMRTVDVSEDDFIISAKITRISGTLAGFTLCLNSTSSPTSFVTVLLDGTSTIRVSKWVSGVFTSVQISTITYVADAELKVHKLGSKFRIYYNDEFLGSELTISDASIVNNTKHGLFSTDVSNQFDNFYIFAAGSDDEYIALDSM